MDAGSHRPLSIEIASLRWERVQLHIEARPALGPAALVGRAFRLERVDPAADGATDAGPEGAVVRAAADGEVVRLRVNVMQGPGLQPLEVGRWRLVEGDGGGAWRAVRATVGAGVDPGRAAATFSLRSGTYGAMPSIGPAGDVDLLVTFDESGRKDPERMPRRGPLVWLSRRLRQARIALFFGLLRLGKVLPGPSRRTILFTSDSRAALTGNLKDVHDRMIERGLEREFRIRTLFKASVAERRRLRDRIRLPLLLAAADVIVIDDYQPIIYRIGVDPAVRIIQLWHASGAFKTVGYSRVGKPGGPSPFSQVHKNYTHAIVSSDHDVPFYAEAFGIPEERVHPTGIPRMDRFFDESARAAGLARARAEFPQIVDRMTILFAPTFRGDGPRTATYDLDRIDYPALHALAVEKDAVVIIKMHPFVRTPLEIPEAYRDRILDGSTSTMDVNDLLFAVDLLVTDYSSIVFEYSTLGRPMLFYAYDLDEYVASRDFYVPFEAFVPGPIVRTFDELLEAIRRDDHDLDRVRAFAVRHFAHLDGGSTDRVIDELIIAP